MPQTILLKRGSEEVLKSQNPKLKRGEPIVVFCNDGSIRLKIGNGRNYFKSLPYSTQIPDDVSIELVDNVLSFKGFNKAKDSTVPIKVSKNALEWLPLDLVTSISKIKDNDSILNLNDRELSTTISLTYDRSTNKISLIGKDNKVLGEINASEFIVSGFLEDVAYDNENNCLVFTWNTTSGIKTDSVQLRGLFNPYVSSNGIEIVDNNIGIKIANDTEPYVSVDNDGLCISGIQSAIDTAITHTNKKIDTIIGTINDINNDYNDLNLEITEIRSDIESLQHSIKNDVDEQLAAITDTIDTIEFNIDSINNSINNFVTTEELNEKIDDILVNSSINCIDGGRISDVYNT